MRRRRVHENPSLSIAPRCARQSSTAVARCLEDEAAVKRLSSSLCSLKWVYINNAEKIIISKLNQSTLEALGLSFKFINFLGEELAVVPFLFGEYLWLSFGYLLDIELSIVGNCILGDWDDFRMELLGLELPLLIEFIPFWEYTHILSS